MGRLRASRALSLAWTALPLLVLGCASQPRAPAASKDAKAVADAAEGVEHPRLRDLLTRHWDEVMARSPVWATRLGDRRFDHRLFIPTEEHLAAARASNRRFLQEAEALPGEVMGERDRITLALFIETLRADVASEVCRFEEWSLSPRDNPLTELNELAELHPLDRPEDGENLIRRYRQAPALVDAIIANLRRGAASGVFPNRESTRRVLTMLADQLAQPPAQWPMMTVVAEPREGWPEAAQRTFRETFGATIREEVAPALVAYRAFLEAEISPHARGPEETGLAALPFGAACYQARIADYTTLDLTAEALHRTGLAEIERINGEMLRLGEALFGAQTLPEILAKLRTDPALYFSTGEEIVEAAEAALAAARAAIPRYFGVLPKADVVVREIPAYEAPFTTIAYYRQPTPDGSRPGEYYINVHQPQTRPRFELEALTFHESIPGHHLQIAIAQELPALPAFRRHLGMTAFVEGWALYTEQLADEMGLYGTDLDRMGMLSYEAWRASRLVVDTGLHAMGWSRDRAKQFMLEHTALAPNNIDNEVDRYIVWPGQALAYKTGQMEIWRLRREAEAALGDAFSLAGFHDVVLGRGAVSLPVLRAQVAAWVASAGGKAEP